MAPARSASLAPCEPPRQPLRQRWSWVSLNFELGLIFARVADLSYHRAPCSGRRKTGRDVNLRHPAQTPVAWGMSDARNHAATRDPTAASGWQPLWPRDCAQSRDPLGQAPDCPLEAHGKSARNQGTEHLNRCFRPRTEFESLLDGFTVLNSEWERA